MADVEVERSAGGDRRTAAPDVPVDRDHGAERAPRGTARVLALDRDVAVRLVVAVRLRPREGQHVHAHRRLAVARIADEAVTAVDVGLAERVVVAVAVEEALVGLAHVVAGVAVTAVDIGLADVALTLVGHAQIRTAVLAHVHAAQRFAAPVVQAVVAFFGADQRLAREAALRSGAHETLTAVEGVVRAVLLLAVALRTTAASTGAASARATGTFVPAGRVAVGARLEPGALVEVARVEALALEQDVARREAVALGASLETPVRADLARNGILLDARRLDVAVRVTAVAVQEIPVVALLVGIDGAVAAGGQGAVRVAVVAEAVAGAVVALLFTLDVAVAADRDRALLGALTLLVVVAFAVVALFADVGDAVTAVRELAVGLAPIAVDVVAVVALLTGHDDAVAALGGGAIVVAPISVDAVAVVAHLVAGDDTVATARGLAGAAVRDVVVASVVVGLVAVVAAFADRLDAVAATGHLAVGITAVVGDRVAVVAGFLAAGLTVATAREDRGAGRVAGAVAGTVAVVLVARLVGGDEAVAAGRGNEDVVREITAEENFPSHALVEETFLAVVAGDAGRGVVLVQRIADVAPEDAGSRILVGVAELAGRGALAVQVTAVEVLGVGVDGGILHRLVAAVHDDGREQCQPHGRHSKLQILSHDVPFLQSLASCQRTRPVCVLHPDRRGPTKSHKLQVFRGCWNLPETFILVKSIMFTDLDKKTRLSRDWKSA
jgi:hypothetical protein